MQHRTKDVSLEGGVKSRENRRSFMCFTMDGFGIAHLKTPA